MVREILQIGNPKLSKRSQDIDPKVLSGKDIQDLAHDLVETCESFGDETAGLSAVQIGVMRRMFVVRRIDLEPESWEVMINPKVTILDNHQTEYWEGCMSIGTGEDRLFGPVPRAKKAKVEYLDVSGAEHSLEVSDYMAHIVLHELDHLEGKLFLQYIDNPRNIWRGGDLDKYLEKHGHYPEIE